MVADARHALAKVSHLLPSSWSWEWFTDVMDVEGGTQPPASEFIGVPRQGYVRLVQIRDFDSDSHITFIPDSPKWRKCIDSDVLIGRYGAALGRICTGLEGAYNVALAKVIPKDRVHLPFAYYLLKSDYFQAPLLASGGRSAQAGFNKGDLSVIPLPLPPLPEQCAIAHILGTLDDKIELNRRISGTLEVTARALFKSWFVDFDPVRAKVEGRWQRGQSLPGLPAHLYELFPDRLVDSELGEIPEGWGIGSFGDLATQRKDSVNPSESAEICFAHFSLPAFDEGQVPKKELGEAIKSNKWKVPSGSVLLSKLNPAIDRTWLVDVGDDDNAICSTEFLVLVTKKPFTRAYVYCLIRSQPFRQQIESLVTGTSKSHQRAQPNAVEAIQIVVPASRTIAAFNSAVSDWLARTLAAKREAGTLAALRDTLLPKLISGELRVRDADAFIAEVA